MLIHRNYTAFKVSRLTKKKIITYRAKAVVSIPTQNGGPHRTMTQMSHRLTKREELFLKCQAGIKLSRVWNVPYTPGTPLQAPYNIRPPIISPDDQGPTIKTRLMIKILMITIIIILILIINNNINNKILNVLDGKASERAGNQKFI